MRLLSLRFASLRIAFALGLAALASACGGNVVIDGAAGSTSGSGGGTVTGVYSAYLLATDSPFYVIFKAEPEPNRCLRLFMVTDPANDLGIQTPAGWHAMHAEISSAASDCGLDPSFQPILGTGPTAGALSGSGTLTQTPPMSMLPCTVSIHATLVIQQAFPGAPASDTLDADGLAIQGPGACQ